MRPTRGRAVVLAAACVFAWVIVAGQSVALPKIPSRSFQSAVVCTCHRPQYDQWRPSMHAKALSDPVYLWEKSEAKKAVGSDVGLFCDTCHTPIGTMSGETKTGKLSIQSREGVTCDFCHQVVGTTKQPPGGASQKLIADGTKRAQLMDAVAPTHDNAYSEFHRTAEFCGTCHNLVSPLAGVKLDDTYDQWKAGPYPALGTVCQDCHMAQFPGAGPIAGRAGSMGPIRDNIYLMTFSGANVALGEPVRARVFLKAAASIELSVPPVISAGEQGSVNVRVTNSGAGHAIPAGVAEIREMWLEVNAIGPDGSKTLLGKKQFGTVFRDAKGNYPAQIWDAVAIQSDDRIPPKGTVELDYALPMDSETSVTVEAVLNYRSFSDKIATTVGVENPITVMARREATVYASQSLLRQASRTTTREIRSRLFDRSWLLAAVTGLAIVILAVIGVVGLRRRRRRRAEQ